jgi:hypothetical protein
MREVETTLEVTVKPDEFRGNLIAKIGAWSIDHKGEKPVLETIFSDLLRKLKAAYYERHKKAITRGVRDLVKVLTGNEGGLSPEAIADARRAEATLVGRFGYSAESARDLAALMARSKYPS